jgi:glutamate racemase
VKAGVEAGLGKAAGGMPHRAILGCTHFPIVEDMFRRHLPPFTRMLSQPELVADSLEDYLTRHQRYRSPAPELGAGGAARVRLLTTGDLAHVDTTAHIFWPEAPRFGRA